MVKYMGLTSLPPLEKKNRRWLFERSILFEIRKEAFKKQNTTTIN